MARRDSPQVRRAEDWFPPPRASVASTAVNVDSKRDVGTIDGELETTSFVVAVDAIAGPVVIDLPVAAESVNRLINFKKIDASANTVTIDGDGAETIDGSATAVLTAQWDSIAIICDGTQWLVI